MNHSKLIIPGAEKTLIHRPGEPGQIMQARIPAVQIPIVYDCFILYALCQNALDRGFYSTKPEIQNKLKIMTNAFEQIVDAHGFTNIEYKKFLIEDTPNDEDETPISESNEGQGEGETGEGSTGEVGEGTRGV